MIKIGSGNVVERGDECCSEPVSDPGEANSVSFNKDNNIYEYIVFSLARYLPRSC